MRLTLRLRARSQAAEEGGSAAKGVANGKSYIRLSKARTPRTAQVTA